MASTSYLVSEYNNFRDSGERLSILKRLSQATGIKEEVIEKIWKNDYEECTWSLKNGANGGRNCPRIREEDSVFCKLHASRALSETHMITFAFNPKDALPEFCKDRITAKSFSKLLDIKSVHCPSYIPSIGLVKLLRCEDHEKLFLIEGDRKAFREILAYV